MMDIFRENVSLLKPAHGTFNFLILFLFIFQAGMGMRIRKARMKGKMLPEIVKRHRKFGPIVAALGIGGYIAGILLVLIDKGQVMRYQAHFAMGTLIVLAIISVVSASRRITAGDSPWRGKHLNRGRYLLFLYGIQVMLGLGVLF